MSQHPSHDETVALQASEADTAIQTSLPMQAPTAQLQPSFWPTRHGLLLADASGGALSQSLATYGEWVEQELDMLGALLDEGSVALQYGAERGVHALALARMVGASGRVHVLDPDRLAHIALCATLALNPLPQVFPLQVLLHATPDDSRDAYEAEGGSGGLVFRTTIDALHLGRLDLLKINEPGVLLTALKGATDTVRESKPLVYFRLSTAELATEEIGALKSLGYRCWSHLPYLYSAHNFAHSKANIFPGWVSQNVIAAHRETALEFAHLSEI